MHDHPRPPPLPAARSPRSLPAVRGPRTSRSRIGMSYDNLLLDAVPLRARQGLALGLEPVTLESGVLLQEAGERIRHVYFPGTALISLLATAHGHPPLEVGLIGNEGMVGVMLAQGGSVTPVAALVQGTGGAMRMSARLFRSELQSNPMLLRIALRFSAALAAQVAQTAACNRFHVIEERLARWLLMSGDRLRSADFFMTHAFLGHMLGVRREGVTEAAQDLQGRGLIDYHRGRIVILDRSGLARAACHCYGTVTAIYAGLGLSESEVDMDAGIDPAADAEAAAEPRDAR